MASLQGTTVTTYNASSTSNASTTLCSTDGALQQWGGNVYITSPYYTATPYVDVFANNNNWQWVTGFISFISYQSYNGTQQVWFALSQYGLQITSGPTNDGLITFSYYQDPSNGSKSWIRFTNTYNVSWGNATCMVNVTLFSPSASAVTSPYLTRYV
jgi:hypothetical protein